MTKTQLDGTMLGVYLNDHLAGATAGTALAHRLAGENRDTIHADALRRLAEEIAEDRASLVDTMARLDVPVRRYKTWLAWAAERAGRLKPNGRLFIRSPLSRVIGLELLTLGVEGKAAAWHTLRTRAATDPRLDPTRYGELLERAQRQSTELENLRRWAVAEAFGGERSDAAAG